MKKSRKIKINLLYLIKFTYYKYCNKIPVIQDSNQTLDEIIRHKKSIARFGDGELNLLHGRSLRFQRFDQSLADRLKAILTTSKDNCLIALPKPLIEQNNLNKKASVFWKNMFNKYFSIYLNYIDINKIYANTNVTRPYIDYQKNKTQDLLFQKFKELFKNRRIFIVEGAASKIGVGNDLLAETTTIRRIITKSKDAYDVYDQLLHRCTQLIQKDELVLIALGPTATVLAYDLSNLGYQAIDIGHLDIEYEWFLQQATEKVPIPGKDVSEAKHFNEGSHPELDAVYAAQILEYLY